MKKYALLVLFLLITMGCIKEEEKPVRDLGVMNLKALIILMPENFRDEEFRIPKEKLEGSGVNVTVAGLQPGEAKGMLGMTTTPDILIDEISIDDYDVIIVPGGAGSPKYLWNNSDVHNLVREAYEKDKIVASICLSGVVLANSGILEGKNATVFATPESVRILEDKGANYLRQGVVVDGKIITADGPQSAERFADEILRLLASK